MGSTKLQKGYFIKCMAIRLHAAVERKQLNLKNIIINKCTQTPEYSQGGYSVRVSKRGRRPNIGRRGPTPS